MKVCITCKNAKQNSDFEKTRNSCRKCRNEKRRVMFDQRAAERRAFIFKEKSKPCTDCGQTFHPVAMDFDHLPGQVKVFEISQGVHQSRSFDAIKAEIAKCELVCANCHRVRTLLRRIGGKSAVHSDGEQVG